MDIAAAILVLLSAQDDRLPGDRPEEIEVLRTKTAYPVQAQELEVDFVLSTLQFEDDRFERTETSLNLELTMGFNDWLTAEVEFPYLMLDESPGDSNSSFGDVQLELKAALRPDLLPVDGALGARVSIPTGDEEAGAADGTVLNLFAAFGHRLDWLGLHAHPYVELEANKRVRYGLNVAAQARPWETPLFVYVGLNTRMKAGGDAEASLVPGAIYRWPGKKTELGVGVPLGITDDAEDWGLITDFQIAF